MPSNIYMIAWLFIILVCHYQTVSGKTSNIFMKTTFTIKLYFDIGYNWYLSLVPLGKYRGNPCYVKDKYH